MRRLKRAISAMVAAGLTAMVWTGSAWAQPVWLQIEARPTLAQARDAARGWSTLPDIAGFALTSGWYAISIGPFDDRTRAEARRMQLRRENLIPQDAYVSDGSTYRQQFWPVGAQRITPAPVPQPIQETALPAIGTPTPGTPTPEANAPETNAPETNAPETNAAVREQARPAPAPQAMPDSDPTRATGTPPASQPAQNALGADLPAETPEQSRRLESQLTATVKRNIQAALKWQGIYSGGLDASFGPGTRSAISAWQNQNGFAATGVLTSDQQKQLLDAAAQAKAVLGLEEVTDSEAGITIDLPTGLVDFEDYDPPFARYSATDGSGIQALLISQAGDATTLKALFDVMQTLAFVPASGTKTLNSNGFVIDTGNAAMTSYTEVGLKNGALKGFTLIWPASGDIAQRNRTLAAMRDSFRASGAQTLDAARGARSTVSRADLLAGLDTRAPAFTRSGFFTDPQGTVVTAAQGMAECRRITVEDVPATLRFNDPDLGLAILSPKTPLAPAQVAAFSTQTPRVESDLTVAGFSYPEALSMPVLTHGTLLALEGLSGGQERARIAARTQPGDAGGPVFDDAGAIIGMLLPQPDDSTRQLPPELSAALQSAAITQALTDQGLDARTTTQTTPPSMIERARGLVVHIGCWH
ncbi:peptidoglycan-binding protein [Rhodobacteraceae bacterium]|nr:peptidoglycan-binding protein [Paracoccaceae bacterium]